LRELLKNDWIHSLTFCSVSSAGSIVRYCSASRGCCSLPRDALPTPAPPRATRARLSLSVDAARSPDARMVVDARPHHRRRRLAASAHCPGAPPLSWVSRSLCFSSLRQERERREGGLFPSTPSSVPCSSHGLTLPSLTGACGFARSPQSFLLHFVLTFLFF
jgi:hypothetical protein